MERMARIGIALIILGTLGACTAGTNTNTGSSSEGLELTDKAAFEEELFYIDMSVSEAPLTLEQLEDTEDATPVRIRFLEEFAVAYYAPDGEPLLDENNIVAVWQIAENIETIEGELDNDGEPLTVDSPPPEYETPGVEGNEMNPAPEHARHTLARGANAPYARIDWLRQFFDDFGLLPPGAGHGSC